MAQTIEELVRCFRFKRVDETATEYFDEIVSWLAVRSVVEVNQLAERFDVALCDVDVAIAAQKMGVERHEIEEALDREEEILEDLKVAAYDDDEEWEE